MLFLRPRLVLLLLALLWLGLDVAHAVALHWHLQKVAACCVTCRAVTDLWQASGNPPDLLFLLKVTLAAMGEGD